MRELIHDHVIDERQRCAAQAPVESKLSPQGWLRAIFWVHDAGKGIYIVDLFWKKTNKISVADIHRANHRIRQLKALLAAGGHPWKSRQ